MRPCVCVCQRSRSLNVCHRLHLCLSCAVKIHFLLLSSLICSVHIDGDPRVGFPLSSLLKAVAWGYLRKTGYMHSPYILLQPCWPPFSSWDTQDCISPSLCWDTLLPDSSMAHPLPPSSLCSNSGFSVAPVLTKLQLSPTSLPSDSPLLRSIFSHSTDILCYCTVCSFMIVLYSVFLSTVL